MFAFPASLEADRLQTALTRRFLTPALSALEDLFLELRAESDFTLPSSLVGRYAKPYPGGCCSEITADVLRRLCVRVSAGRQGSAGERALIAFVKQGGRINSVWGVLRDRYFQNALQVGGLYVDVANDTVDPNKPKVEILPMPESGLVLVRDGSHFARIGESYWNARLYTNTALPALAPHFPMILVWPTGVCQLAARNTYMVQLFARDGFRPAEQWLREGAPAPLWVVDTMRQVSPPDLLGDTPPGLEAALAACQRLRRTRMVVDERKMEALLGIFDRTPAAQANLALAV
ncbi:hypothetical protein CA606_10110 [Caulobacter vibrioides]|uniref:Uncharacterized protein n=1 Tax=Caulobacter vibrioides TaxID=155892 RepID=A0A290MKY7_CAUVI|nr:hypothetical protein [Caulobacter vibrioides]ATC32671.1 hypothetical protein CA606_10110 [Caulobacter vibrioides]